MKKLLVAFLSFTGFTAFSNAKTISYEARSAAKVEQLLAPLLTQHDPKKVLVLFDIDMTLTQTDHPAFYYKNLKKHYALVKETLNALTPLARDETLSATVYFPQKLTDSAFPGLIKTLQKHDVLCLALTSRLVGPLQPQDVPMEKHSYDTLKGFDIDFEKGWLFKEKDYFDLSRVLKKSYRKHFPTYYKGILVNNGERGPYEKVDTLLAFLEYAWRVRPEVIVLIDDKKENLEKMAKGLTTSNKVYPKDLPLFVGIHYKGAENLETRPINEAGAKDFWQQCLQRACTTP
ncbi:MAG: DUF2608 domain-containing protein [Alphaproteobacteria bacterium]|nr:DUF2608 domain-containing protein [Alphaproteobacteria bacterium]